MYGDGSVLGDTLISPTKGTRHQVAAFDVPLRLGTIRDFGARD